MPTQTPRTDPRGITPPKKVLIIFQIAAEDLGFLFALGHGHPAAPKFILKLKSDLNIRTPRLRSKNEYVVRVELNEVHSSEEVMMEVEE